MSNFFKMVFSLFIMMIFSINSAIAGDSSLPNIIGYSKDGRYFAFEEFGIQDGSGFAYSSIYILDLKDNNWVVGTPIKTIGGENEEEPFDYQKLLKETREKTLKQAKLRLDGLGVNWPAIALAYNGDGAPNEEGVEVNEGHSIKFFIPGLGGGARTDIYEISLEIFKTKSALSCFDWFGERPIGFLLKLKNDGDDIVKEVYRDEALSRSRNCPLNYKISAVYIPFEIGDVPFEAVDLKSAVALISVFSSGYEGPDRRFIAVSIGNE